MRAALAVAAAILIPVAVVLFFAWIALRTAPECTCGDPDCGGGCLGEGGFVVEPLEGRPGLIVVRRRGYRDTIIGTEAQDRQQLLDEARERIVRRSTGEDCSMKWVVIVGALICIAPVVFGLIVAKWDRRWSRASRPGALVPAMREAPSPSPSIWQSEVNKDRTAREEFERDCG